jgi:CBS domain containing-hemolysin-like protein
LYFLGVLALRKKTVKEAMTWLPDVYALDKDRKTDTELLLDVHKHGFSRIPVYSNEKFVVSFRSIIYLFVHFLQIECYWYC